MYTNKLWELSSSLALSHVSSYSLPGGVDVGCVVGGWLEISSVDILVPVADGTVATDISRVHQAKAKKKKR